MSQVASRELRNNTRALLDRVAAGERVEITVDGRCVAALVPVDTRPRWRSRDEFLAMPKADAALSRELAEMMPDTTDDLRW